MFFLVCWCGQCLAICMFTSLAFPRQLCLVVMYLLSILYILLNEFASGFLEMLVSVFIGNIGQSFFVVLFVSGFGIRESY